MSAQNVFEPIYTRATDALNRGDLDTYISAYAPGFILHNLSAGIIETREQHKQGLQEVLEHFPDIQLTLEEVVCQGTLEKGELVMRFMLDSGAGKGTWQGIPVEGRKVDFYSYLTLHLVDGKYVEGWQLDDGLRFYTQLGVIPEMTGA